MKPISIENLREFAKLNMDEKCFQIYLQIIEPNIKSIIQNYFGGWPSIESSILQIVMRINGAYKTSTNIIFNRDDDRMKHSDLVDLEKYKKFEKYSFKQKLDNLFDHQIIGSETYKLLDNLRIKRNEKIHGDEPHFSDEDRDWFEMGYSVISSINFSIHDTIDPKIKNRMTEYAEKTAEFLNTKYGLK